jgi:uncharacterized protein YciW
MNKHDIVDRVAGLAPGSAAYLTRHQREKVVAATQLSDTALFDPALPDLPLSERLLVALYASALSQAMPLSAHYRERLVALDTDPTLIDRVARTALDEVVEPRLHELLRFTHTLITQPVAGDKAALQRLPAAGLTTPAVVALAQLIGYVSYQIRLVAGLRALNALNALEPHNPTEPV